MSALIEVHTLTDGGQAPLEVARMIAAFVEPARETLELALYDVRLEDETEEIVRSARDLGFQALLAGQVEAGPRQVLLEPVGVRFGGEELELSAG